VEFAIINLPNNITLHLLTIIYDVLLPRVTVASSCNW